MNCAVLPLCRADVDVVWHAFILERKGRVWIWVVIVLQLMMFYL